MNARPIPIFDPRTAAIHFIRRQSGTAFVTGESTLLFDDLDPFRTGLP